MLGYKTSLRKFKKTEIIPSILSHHKALKFDTNFREKVGKPTNGWRLNGMLLKDDWVKEEIRGEITRHIETEANEIASFQNY